MSQYHGECPVCKQNIKPGDDAVVCPECGTPYHRACWQKAGSCVNTERHGTGFEYQVPQPEAKAAPGGGAEGYSAPTAPCPSCGAQNNTRNIFCDRCGTPLHGKPQGGTANGTGPMGGFGMGGMGAMPGFEADLSGEIDGIPKRDWNVFICSSQLTYLTRLSQQQQRGTKTGFMFSAFFVPHYYFAYRKMWGWAALVTLLTLAFYLPTIGVMVLQSGYSVLGLTMDQMNMLVTLTSWVSLVMRFLCGVFSLWLYRQDACKKIKALREKHPEEAPYQEALKKAGGVSWVGVVAVVALVTVFYAVCMQFISPEVVFSYVDFMMY